MAGWSPNAGGPSWVLRAKHSPWKGSRSGLHSHKIQAQPGVRTLEPSHGEMGRGTLEITRVTWQSGKTLQVIAALGEPRLGDTGGTFKALWP